MKKMKRDKQSRRRQPALRVYLLTAFALTILFELSDVTFAQSQWTTNSNNINNTNTGNVGIGTDKPEEMLDVVSTIRARARIRFDDGAILTSATDPSPRVKVRPNAGIKQPTGVRSTSPSLIGGTGTINKLAKWIDNSGTLGYSAITETGGLSIFGQTPPLFPTASSYHVAEIIASGAKTPLVLAGGSDLMEFWKDAGNGGGPQAAVAFGMATPGTAATKDVIFSTYLTGQSWFERLRITKCSTQSNPIK
jgi:hypothetical protein